MPTDIPAPPLRPLAAAPGFSDAAIFQLSIFEEPLVPLGGETSPTENQALVAALAGYSSRVDGEGFEALTTFLSTHPTSPWRASLLANLGMAYRRAGYFSLALEAFEEAWTLAKDVKEPAAVTVGFVAVGELAELAARLGRGERLEALMKELEGRDLEGPVTVKVDNAREGLWNMRNRPTRSFLCGPLGLAAIKSYLRTPEPRLLKETCTPTGTNLAHNLKLSRKYGMAYQMAKREPGASIPVPALMHWKAGHFAALVKEKNGSYLFQDPTFGGSFWMTRAAIDSEASGYALIAQESTPKGWAPVSESEGSSVWGKGHFGPPDATRTSADDHKAKGDCGNSKGMPSYNFHSSVASLNIQDTPVGYAPPRGPSVNFQVTYNQRESTQPATFTFSNLGAKWTHNWLSYLTDQGTGSTSGNITINLKGGGQRTFSGFDAATQSWGRDQMNMGQLVRTSSTSYELRYPDGSRDVFSFTNGVTTNPRKVFLTQSMDAAGNAVAIAYDTSSRITTITDALGQVTTLSYTLPADTRVITQVTDPFGRTAVFTFDASKRLTQITDAIGMASSFTYGPTADSPSAPADFINAMTTPYGTTRFQLGTGVNNQRWVMATDPLGGRERIEYLTGVVGTALGEPIPSDFSTYAPTGGHDDFQNTSFFWDKRAMAQAPGDYTQAHIMQWAPQPNFIASNLLLNEKKPLESRQWYWYQGVTKGDESYYPSARRTDAQAVLADGSTRRSFAQYNAAGNATLIIDPVGRQTSNLYSADGLDVIETRNITNGINELLAQVSYNANHQPLTVKDAAGQTTTYTYNAQGQLATILNAKSEQTTFTYNPAGYLTRIAGPVTGANLDFTYDPVGKVRTVTRSDGHVLTYDYDALDRVTKVTYPDGTYEQKVYQKLDLASSRDRSGGITTYTHNALGQMTEILDPMGRITRLDWCGCGQLEGILDPSGNLTTWARDIRGRVTAKVYPDLTRTAFLYDTAGRIQQKTDAKGQTTNYSYTVDGKLSSVAFPNALYPTPSVLYTYDSAHDRLTEVTDGTGTTAFTYNSITGTPALGAGRLATATSPLANSTIAYGYDELSRVISRSVNGVVRSREFDALGRVTRNSHSLGSFDFTFDGLTNRVSSMTYPSLQKTLYTYFDSLGDHRLSSIQNLKSTNANISTFGFTYDVKGRIATWSQQVDAAATPNTFTFGYDATDQVTSAVLRNSIGTILNEYAYGFDAAGNRTSEGVDAATTTSTFDGLNRLISQRYSLNSAPIIRKQAEREARSASAPKAPAKKKPPVHVIPASTLSPSTRR